MSNNNTASTSMMTLRDFAKLGYANFDETHSYEHANEVWKNVKKQLDAGIVVTTIERNILKTAALLHDTIDHKYVGKGLPPAQIHEWIITNSDPIVWDIINNMSWSKESRGENKPLPTRDYLRLIVQYADWLEALGQIGLDRCIGYSIVLGHASPTQIRTRVVKHIHEKLLRIPGMINPEYTYAHAEAIKRLEPIQQYLAAHSLN